MCNKRHKWNMQEIEKVLILRRQGITLNKIGQLFNVTGNAVRKALQRHCTMYQKNVKIKPYNLFFTIDNIIKDGIKNQIICLKNNNLYHKGQVVCKTRAVIIINKVRVENNLPTLRVIK